MQRIHALLACLIMCALASTALADGLIVISKPLPEVEHRRIMPPDHPVYAPLRVKYHHVNVTIKNQVAVTEVDQVFVNPSSQRLEGHYMFPLPVGAQIDRFSMDIDGKQVEAELLDADKARKIYTDIVRSMKDPALLEYAGRGMFKVRIFPIEPHSEKRVKLKYTQLLDSDSNLVNYNYPLNTEKFSSAPIDSVAVKVSIESRQPLRNVYSPSHEVEITRKDDRHAVIGFEVKDARPDTDFDLYYSVDPKQDVGVNVMTWKAADSKTGYFLLLASPSVEIAAEKIVSKDVMFVLDTSGSMAGEKLEQAKKALSFCIANLNPGDRFEIVRFSTEAELMFGGLKPADDQHTKKARDFVAGFKPIGGTAIEEALNTAQGVIAERADAARRPAVVIFLTDGVPTIGSTDTDALVKAGKSGKGARVFTFGIGTDINTHLLDRLAQETRAVSQYVLPTEDIEVKVSSFYTKISSPVLSGVKLAVKGDAAPVRWTKVYPPSLPDLFRGDQLVVLGQYETVKDAQVAIELSGTVNGEAKSIVYEADFPVKAEELGFIPRLWAVRRVGYLLDQIRLNGESAELKDEVVVLAKQFNIVTPYTSYLIVEDERRAGVAANRQWEGRMADDVAASAPTLTMGQGAAGGRVGRDAVAQSRQNSALREAKNVDALSRADAEAVVVAPEAALRTANSSVQSSRIDLSEATEEDYEKAQEVVRQVRRQASRYIAGRTFFLRDGVWVDTALKDDAKKARKIEFGSDEYFALIEKNKSVSQWLSLGQRVDLVVDNELVQVR